MKLRLVACSFGLCLLLWTAAASGQSSPSSAAAPEVYGSPGSTPGTPAPVESAKQVEPVSYASVTQLNGLLGQLEAASKTTQVDLGKLRIERWKADGSYKKQSLSNVDSIQRNLQGALPEMMAQLRAAPEDMPATFKLYRNLDALYDVMVSVVESAGAFGSKDDFQSLSNDLSSFETTRKAIAGRIETLASSKEAEIVRLRTDLRAAQAAIPVAPPKKTLVDDTESAKKPVAKKKPAVKKPPSAPPTAPPGQAPPAAAKPQ